MTGPTKFGFKLGGSSIAALALIAFVVAAAAAAIAYTGGWFSPHRLTPDRMVDALSRRGGDPLGHRRNHAKGICFTGYFEANGAGARLSTAPMLAAGRYPVIGRFAIATGNPRCGRRRRPGAQHGRQCPRVEVCDRGVFDEVPNHAYRGVGVYDVEQAALPQLFTIAQVRGKRLKSSG